jgi:DNA-binding NarL/FixJ family response regulator
MKCNGSPVHGRRPRRIVIARKRIYIVDRHSLLRTTLGSLLNSEPGLEFCGGEARPDHARQAIARLKPDLLIIGIPLPSPGAIRFIEEQRRAFPATPIIAYSLHDESLYVERALRAGASAYVLKESGSERLLQVVRSLLFHPAHVQPPADGAIPEREAA